MQAKRFKVVKSEQPSAFGDDSDEDAPILAKKIKTEKVKKAKKKKHQSDDEDDDDYDDAPIMKKPKKEKVRVWSRWMRCLGAIVLIRFGWCLCACRKRR